MGYPFQPRSNASLKSGQFWSIPLSDGRFACGRVLRTGIAVHSYGARVMFIGALVDWVGAVPPTAESIAGRPVFEPRGAHVRVISEPGGAVLGERPLELDGIAVPPPEIHHFWGWKGAIAEAERRLVRGNPTPTGERRQVSSPLTESMLAPSRTGRGVVQFSHPLTDEDYARLALWLRDYPDMMLRAYLAVRNLDFLRFFGFHRHFELEGWNLESTDGLGYLPDDTLTLGLGMTKRRIDLGFLERFRGLERLWLEGQHRHIEVVSRLTKLEELTLRSVTLPDLSMLVPLERLVSLDIKLGGTNDLRLLPKTGRLRYLELWRINGLTDIAPIGELPHLREAYLQALPRVTALPDLSGDGALKRLTLHGMKGIIDLAPLATAPALEQLVLTDMHHLQPDDFLPLAGIPSLRALAYDLGSAKKHDAVKAMVDLPDVFERFDWRA